VDRTEHVLFQRITYIPT